MNKFGGNWTEQKIEMVVSYAKAYLVIMNKYPQFKTLYFDGFAGSGDIDTSSTEMENLKGASIRVLEIENPKTFDVYYFVEKDEANKTDLGNSIKEKFSNRKVHVVNEDCNNKLQSMASFLKMNKSYKVLAFIDPYGMAVNWKSIECLKELGIDLWILVPTGLGVNRLLKRNGEISDSWLNKLELFLGINRDEIINHFYKRYSQHDLFSEQPVDLRIKENNAISKIHSLYTQRLLTVFKYVSEAFVLRNSNNSIMYHFMMATNNTAALKIANDIVKPKFKL